MKLMKNKAGAPSMVFGIGYTVVGLRFAAISTTNSCEPKAENRKPYTVYLLLLVCALITSSCGVYSFTGTTLSPTIKTVTVNNFVLATAGGPANLPLTFNERLKEYYQRYTNLKVVPVNGDLLLEGNITGYELIPVAPTAQDQAGVNRLQITILVRFYNNKDETKNFEQPFSFYKDFPQSQTLSQNESRLVPQILDQIVLDIFNKTAADW